MLVPKWATWDEFRRLEALGLTMYGQMTAGSWIYIGTQGILQGTFETLAAAARKHFGGSLKGRLVVTAGLGGMGGAQPLAVTMNGGVAIIAEVDPARIKRRLDTKYVDTMTESLDEALKMANEACKKGQPLSIALLANAADLLPELVKRGITPDVLTDQTSAHDELNGYVPRGLPYEEALELRKIIHRIISAAPTNQWQLTLRLCSNFRKEGPELLIMATTSAVRPKKQVWKKLLTFPVLFKNISGRFFAWGKVLFAGWPCLVSRKIFMPPMKLYSKCFPRMSL